MGLLARDVALKNSCNRFIHFSSDSDYLFIASTTCYNKTWEGVVVGARTVQAVLNMRGTAILVK